MNRRGLGLGALALGAGAMAAPQHAAAQGRVLRALEDIEGDALAEVAYLLSQECYAFGYPLVMMDATNRVVTAVPRAGEFSAPYNQFLKMRGIVPPEFKNVVRISVNSVWSVAVLDLDREPVVMSYGASGSRYLVIQLLNMWTDDFGSLGTRTGETSGGRFLIAGPKWTGNPPADVTRVFRCPTRYAWVLVQMADAGPQDLPAIHAMQEQLQITPVSAWGQPFTPPDTVPVDPTVDTTATPYDQVRLMTGEMFFSRLALLLGDNPAYPADAPMLAKLRRLGVVPGQPFDRNAVSPAILRGMNRAPPAVWQLLATGPYSMTGVNGWLNFLDLGRYGTDYNTRAFIAYAGLGALTKEDAVYPSAFVDGDGRVLDAGAKYVLRFERGQTPPSAANVWSVSLYRENFYVRNAINRYGVTSGMPLRYGADGSLEIYIQSDNPGPEREANWLPSPPSLPFNLTIRVYQPQPALLDGSYRLPPVRRVG